MMRSCLLCHIKVAPNNLGSIGEVVSIELGPESCPRINMARGIDI